MNTKENIINRLRETNRENIEKVIDYMEGNGFFDRGCHRHHRYDGGLAEHAWQTYQMAMKEEADNKRLHPDVPLLDKDSLAICALLHDFCDCRGIKAIHNTRMPSIAIFVTSYTRQTANQQRNILDLVLNASAFSGTSLRVLLKK